MKPLAPAILSLFLAVFGAGCVTNIKSTVTHNPPPEEKFSNFSQIELSPVTLAPSFAGEEANERALAKIQENVTVAMTKPLAQWNAAPANGAARTLLIEPVVTEIKFINGTARFWGGAMAGSSAVVLRAKISEKETGRVIATPEFYAKAAAMGGAWSFGGTDNAMLVRIANRLTSYLVANYDHAVGGPSGVEPDPK